MSLTETQYNHLKKIQEYIKITPWKHTYSGIAEHLVMSPQSAKEMVDKLIEKGFIDRLTDGNLIVKKKI